MEPSTALQNPPTPPGQKRAQGRQGAVRLCREPADGCRRACTGARRMRAGRRGCRLGRLHGSLPLVRRPEGKCGGKGKGDGAGPRPREAEPFARAREAGGRRAGARPREVEPVALAAGQHADRLLLVGALEVEVRAVRAHRQPPPAQVHLLRALADCLDHRDRRVQAFTLLVSVPAAPRRPARSAAAGPYPTLPYTTIPYPSPSPDTACGAMSLRAPPLYR